MNRLFLSLPVTLSDYKKLQEEFSSLLQGRWVPEQNLHLTLAFFGDLYEPEELCEKLSHIDLNVRSSQIESLELFKQDSILCAKTENPSLFELYQRLQEIFFLPPEDFIPHITLMRIKKIKDRGCLMKRLQQKEELPLGKLHPQIQLIQSKLTPQGPLYTSIQNFPISAER